MKKGKPMPKAIPFVVAVLVPILVGAIGYIGLVKPKNAQAAQIDAKTQAVQMEISNRKAQLSSVSAAPKIKYADVYRLQQALPATMRVPDLILELDRIAAGAGISFDSISFPASAPAVAGVPYAPFGVTVVFSGNFYTVTDLLYRLRSLVSVRHGVLDASGPLISVDSVVIAPSDKNLQVTVSLSAYTYVAAAPAPASVPVGVPPAGTTSTSTDTTSTTTTPTGTTSATAQGAP